MRNSRLAHAIAGSRANNTPCPRQFCPKRRPPRPRHPIIGVFRRGGLHFGRHTTPNRDHATSNHNLTATKRGELHHERRDTPATRRGKASNGAKPPSPKIRRTPKGPESAGEPGRDLLSDDTASKREKLHHERRAVELTPRRGRHQTGGIAALEARHAGDTPWQGF